MKLDYFLVSTLVEREVCTIAEECFTVPSGYQRLNRGRGMVDEEEELLQLAIRQSLMDQEGRRDGGEGDGAEQVSGFPLVPRLPSLRSLAVRSLGMRLSWKYC